MDCLRSTASLAVDRRPATACRPAARGGLLLALPASWFLHKLDHILFREHYLGNLAASLFAHINLAAPGDGFALAGHGPRGTPSFPVRAGGGDAEEQFRSEEHT